MAEPTTEPLTSFHQYQFDVEGMTCAACVTNVESAIASLAGTKDISVNLATESLSVSSLEPIPIKRFVRIVAKAGYRLEPKGASSLMSRQQRTIANWRKLLLTQAIFGVPLLIYAMLDMFTDIQLFSISAGMIVQAVLASILVISGSGYYRRGFKHLMMRVPNMDSLVALGTGSAYAYSIVSTLNIFMEWKIQGFQTLYFEAAGTILLFITFGKWLEAVARGKTTEALTGLIDQMPSEAEVFQNDKWQVIALEDVNPDDLIRVKPHSKIPVDGVVTKGSSSADESSISGESFPVEKYVGEKVIGASLNLEGVLEIRADKVGRDSIFGQIIKLVEDAQLRKPEIQRLVDRIAAVFVPTVLALALTGGLIWFLLGFGLTFAINVMISVLIIACPCALGLATPTALVVGSGIAARGGILIKSADAFQQLSKVEVMVFDKTGTLTESKPVIAAMYPNDSSGFIKVALGLELHSQHPLAGPIIDFGKLNSITPEPIDDIQEKPGWGMQGTHEGSVVRIQKIDDTTGLNVDFTQALDEFISKGYMVSAVYRAEIVLGLIAFKDGLKSSSASVIHSLTKSGIETVLLTGDKEISAQQAAQELKIDTLEAEMLPAEKHDLIRRYQAQGKTVGMLGDGINDAPALVVADVGLSFRGSTDIAINAADIIFLNDSLNNVIYGRRIARATISKIHQNLFWAFIYNLAGIPIALGMLYPLTGTLLNPMFAGMAMALSSVSVVSNTLLLRSRNFFRQI